MINYLSKISELSIFYFLPIGLILVFLAIKQKNLKLINATFYILIAILISTALILSPKLAFFSTLSWNWQGKILDFLWPWLVIFGFSWLTPKEVGIYWLNYKSDLKLIFYFSVFGILLMIFIQLIFQLPTAQKPNLESILYQLTMPGLAEEITIRGVYLAILNRFLGKPWKIANTSFGMGIILVTIVFVMEHVHFGVQTIDNYIDLFQVIVFGIIYGYVREKTGSIWPAVILHNLLNVAGLFVGLIF